MIRSAQLLTALVCEESYELVLKLVFTLRNERALVPGALIGTGMSPSQPSLEARADEDEAEYERERARPRKGVVFGRMPPSASASSGRARAGSAARPDEYDDDEDEYSDPSDDENGTPLPLAPLLLPVP